MNILVVHNFYQQPGGEDAVFREECALLEARGHQVIQHTVHNDSVAEMGKLTLARKTLYNRDSYDAIAKIVRDEKIDVAHFHNTFPLVSPAGYDAAKDNGAGVVQTLHNYRLLCPAATFLRDGKVCEDCLGKTFPYPAVAHKCYRGSRAISLVSASMLARNRLAGTYKNSVGRYIALTQFMREKMIQGGLPVEKIVVKPNFVDPDPGPRPGRAEGTPGYAVFVGRLAEEKGIETLLKAWDYLPDLRLKIIGDGPMKELVTSRLKNSVNLEYLGRLKPPEVYNIVGGSDVLVFPSVWYEGMPRTIVEAYAVGTPVVASRLGSMTELIEPGRTGDLFAPGDADALATAVRKIVSDPAGMSAMRVNCRATFEAHYGADANYRTLMEIYGAVTRKPA